MVEYRFAEDIEDLIQPEEYAADPEGRQVKVRLRWTEDGVEIVGDAIQPLEMERLLEGLDPEVIELMLCG